MAFRPRRSSDKRHRRAEHLVDVSLRSLAFAIGSTWRFWLCGGRWFDVRVRGGGRLDVGLWRLLLSARSLSFALWFGVQICNSWLLPRLADLFLLAFWLGGRFWHLRSLFWLAGVLLLGVR